jgi:hypothetical protein
MKHCFIDCETLGPEAKDCVVIDFSFFVVDSDKFISNNPYTINDIDNVKKFKLSVKDQVDNYNWLVYNSTIEWWQTLPKEARRHIKPRPDDLLVTDFVDNVTSYLQQYNKIDYWWSRSNSFDPVIISRLFASVNKYGVLNSILPHWKVRDIRTYIDAKLDYPVKNGFVPIEDTELWLNTAVEHDSAWDVLADVLRMQRIIRVENDL